jgi:hypothetical protein
MAAADNGDVEISAPVLCCVTECTSVALKHCESCKHKFCDYLPGSHRSHRSQTLKIGYLFAEGSPWEQQQPMEVENVVLSHVDEEPVAMQEAMGAVALPRWLLPPILAPHTSAALS